MADRRALRPLEQKSQPRLNASQCAAGVACRVPKLIWVFVPNVSLFGSIQIAVHFLLVNPVRRSTPRVQETIIAKHEPLPAWIVKYLEKDEKVQNAGMGWNKANIPLLFSASCPAFPSFACSALGFRLINFLIETNCPTFPSRSILWVPCNRLRQ